MGAVYAAWQRSVGREVAVKVLREPLRGEAEARRRFLRELRAISRLRHPNIVTLFEFGQTDDGLLYLVMELLEGESLRVRLDAGRTLSPHDAARLFARAAAGLAHGHARNVVHGDAKPDNLVIEHDGDGRERLALVDFGVAAIRVSTGEGERLSGASVVAGTPRYLSPERLAGAPPDPAGDLFALGVSLYEALTAAHPFGGRAAAIGTEAAERRAPVPVGVRCPLDVPAALEALVDELLAFEPASRPSDAVRVAERLRAIAGGVAGDPPATPVHRRGFLSEPSPTA